MLIGKGKMFAEIVGATLSTNVRPPKLYNGKIAKPTTTSGQPLDTISTSNTRQGATARVRSHAYKAPTSGYDKGMSKWTPSSPAEQKREDDRPKRRTPLNLDGDLFR